MLRCGRTLDSASGAVAQFWHHDDTVVALDPELPAGGCDRLREAAQNLEFGLASVKHLHNVDAMFSWSRCIFLYELTSCCVQPASTLTPLLCRLAWPALALARWMLRSRQSAVEHNDTAQRDCPLAVMTVIVAYGVPWRSLCGQALAAEVVDVALDAALLPQNGYKSSPASF